MLRYPDNEQAHGTPLKKYCISKVSESNTRQEYPQLPKLMKLFLEPPRNLQFHTEHQSLLMVEVLVAGKETAGMLWCSSHLPLRHSVLTCSTDRTAQLSKPGPQLMWQDLLGLCFAKCPEWRHHHMKHQERNTLDTSAGISDSRMPNFRKNKKIHVLFCRQTHCKTVTSVWLSREKTGSPDRLSPRGI